MEEAPPPSHSLLADVEMPQAVKWPDVVDQVFLALILPDHAGGLVHTGGEVELSGGLGGENRYLVDKQHLCRVDTDEPANHDLPGMALMVV